MESAKNVDKTICHDCQKEIADGFTLFYDNNSEKIKVYKCKKCYKKNSQLTNFQQCEVYSRIVGYIRPVAQWHKGKQKEFSERKEYKMIKGCGCI